VHEFGFLMLAERPESMLAVPRHVKGQRTCLKVRRAKISVFVDQVELEMTIAVKNDTLGGECLEWLSPEIQTKIPFGCVEFGSVEFVVPAKLPIFLRRQKTWRMFVEIELLHFLEASLVNMFLYFSSIRDIRGINSILTL